MKIFLIRPKNCQHAKAHVTPIPRAIASCFDLKIVSRGNNTFTNNYGGDGAFTGTLAPK